MPRSGPLPSTRLSTTAVVLALLCAAGLTLALGPAPSGSAAPQKCPSPFDVAFSPDGKRLAVSDRPRGVLAILDVAGAKVAASIPLKGNPTGVLWSPDGARIYAAEYGASSVAEIDPSAGKVLRRLPCSLRPMGIALAPKTGLLLAAGSATDTVSVIRLKEGREVASIGVPRRPFSIAVTPDEALAVVANALPDGRADDPASAAALSVIDLKKLERVADIRLPPGSTNLRESAISVDGKWAYAVHTVGRTQVPTTQLDRGWVNTNALSIIDLAARTCTATVLLDHPMEGAADPWGLALSRDGRRLYVSLSGTHQVVRLELATMHEFLDGKLPDNHRLARAKSYSPGTESIWLRIKRDRKERAELVNDLAALYAADLVQRIALGGKGPRGVDLSPDGKTLAAALYYSGTVALVDTEKAKVAATLAIGPRVEPDDARRGELVFHDATYCFQHWMSCATCHEDARVDGLNWDLLNDGIGNPKNVRSLLWSYKTPPVMTLGVRSDMAAGVKAGFIHILFRQPEEATLKLVQAYLTSLQPEPSPRLLAGGKLSDAARRGRAIFESKETGCTHCHPAPLYTDLKTYDIGTRGPLDRNSKFDTPTLKEIYRTAPYLHDGSAATIHDVFVGRNKQHKHGKTSQLTPEQINDLVEFLLSL